MLDAIQAKFWPEKFENNQNLKYLYFYMFYYHEFIIHLLHR